MSANSTFNSFDTAASNGQRPTTGFRGTSARPTTSHYNRGGTAISRGGGGPPPHGDSSSQRIGTAIGYAGNFMATERPLTQHGLSGLPTTASVAAGGQLGSGRLGTAAGMRQIKDKRYWQSQLQLKMAEIQRETDRLARERDVMQRERSAKRSFEKRVQEAAKELTALQSTLTDMNIVLDAHTSGLTRQQLQHETTALREHNERTHTQLEHAFHQRQTRTAQATELQAAIAAERQRLDDMVLSLPIDDQQQYRQLRSASEHLHQQLAAAQERDAAVAAQLQRLQQTVGQSAVRSDAVRLLSKLAELQQRGAALRDEEAQRPSPAQERELLIAAVRDNQQSLVGFNNQLRLIEAQLQERRELLAQVEQDLEEGQSDRHAKYKELRRRDETMTAFMEQFAESLEREKRTVGQLQNQITYGIEQITMQGINLQQLGIAAADGGAADQRTNDLGSHESLVREYKRLGVQLQQLQLLERRTGAQLADLRAVEQECVDEVARFGNVQALRDEAAARMAELTATVEQLQHKRTTTDDVVAEARRRNDAMKSKLTGHERFRQIAHLEEKLSDLMRSNADAELALAQHRREHDYSELQAKVERQLAKVMEMLMASEEHHQ